MRPLHSRVECRVGARGGPLRATKELGQAQPWVPGVQPGGDGRSLVASRLPRRARLQARPVWVMPKAGASMWAFCKASSALSSWPLTRKAWPQRRQTVTDFRGQWVGAQRPLQQRGRARGVAHRRSDPARGVQCLEQIRVQCQRTVQRREPFSRWPPT